MRATVVTILLAVLGCGGTGIAGSDAGTPLAGGPDGAIADAGQADAGKADAGQADAGQADAGKADAGQADAGQADAGGVDGGSPDAGAVGALLDLFEVSGTVSTAVGNVSVQMLVASVSVLRNPQPAYPYDDRDGGVLGCFADHYNQASASTMPPTDANAGTMTITGYAGGAPYGSLSKVSAQIQCAVASGYYSCDYGTASSGTAVASQVFSSGTNPLGNGTIMFSGGPNSVLGTFDLTATAAGNISVTSPSLSSISYGSVPASGVELDYACSPSPCGSYLVIVMLAAAQSTASNPTAASPTFGAVFCAAEGGSSITIPQGAVSAMIDGDTALKSVVTSVVVTNPPATPATDSEGNPIAVLVGRGPFGVSSL